MSWNQHGSASCTGLDFEKHTMQATARKTNMLVHKVEPLLYPLETTVFLRISPPRFKKSLYVVSVGRTAAVFLAKNHVCLEIGRASCRERGQVGRGSCIL